MTSIAIACLALVLGGLGLMHLRKMNQSAEVGDRRALTIPLNGDTGAEATLIVPFALSEAEWDVLQVTLNAMQPGLVVYDDAPPAVRDPLAAVRQHEAAIEAAAQDTALSDVHPFRRPRGFGKRRTS